MDLGLFLDFILFVFFFFCSTPKFGIVGLVWVGHGILVLLVDLGHLAESLLCL